MENNSDENKPVYCDCGAPLLKRIGSREFDIFKQYKGQKIRMTLGYSGNNSYIICKDCGKKVCFSTNKISLPMSYEIALPKVT